ncbi:(2Fe-2S)-binding protein [Pseudogemmobacter blasticus]|uniref:(2Fe-2S)-binding protein n=1 Tax=Fuscovulum blasticum DSM 2131 TaxID=1188250 RepID=A0A2T4JD82_FUSBL|nr:(2Fe-2S)-binding protein [Fuscovulum blasticum]AWD23194.1 (2Fe-2S)-binding protein [Fuscovulum blasticum]PTE15866.1 (2Fe-2S)-binding protein [Fuscovulum blasticum DSM 2131]
MIVCHCQNISDRDIRAAVDWMRAADPQTIITPGKIYHALGRRADCGGCMPLFLDTMRACDSFGVATADAAQPAIPVLRSVKGKPHEGRRQGHRVSQRGTAV